MPMKRWWINYYQLLWKIESLLKCQILHKPLLFYPFIGFQNPALAQPAEEGFELDYGYW